MSAEYEGQDPLKIAQQAERELNSESAKQGASTESTGVNRHGYGASDSSKLTRHCVSPHHADPTAQPPNPALTKPPPPASLAGP
jgi:hypothetical protein